jgi:hypothetical protein
MLIWEYGPGCLIKYIGCTESQLSYLGENDPRELGLEVGKSYQVSSIALSGSWSMVSLVDYDGWFNTVFFEAAGHTPYCGHI